MWTLETDPKPKTPRVLSWSEDRGWHPPGTPASRQFITEGCGGAQSELHRRSEASTEAPPRRKAGTDQGTVVITRCDPEQRVPGPPPREFRKASARRGPEGPLREVRERRALAHPVSTPGGVRGRPGWSATGPAAIPVHFTLVPGSTSSRMVTSPTTSLSPAASTIPCDSTPMSLAGLRLATTTTRRPMRLSGSYLLPIPATI